MSPQGKFKGLVFQIQAWKPLIYMFYFLFFSIKFSMQEIRKIKS